MIDGMCNMHNIHNINIQHICINTCVYMQIFFLITNFGVWLNGSYGYTIVGFISCYILALPFFGYSVISTIIFSVIIETIYKFYKTIFVKI